MPIIQQIFMHGDSLQPSLVSIVVPEPAAFETFLAGKGLSGKDWNSTEVRKAVLAELASYGKAQGLKGFEMPRNVFIEKEAFTLE
jgi:long-chain acyl-CoA synthetase